MAMLHQYNNIPHELGKQGISFWIDKYLETLHPRFNKKITIDGIELILHNFFLFNNVNYVPTLRAAMGTNMTPIYATVTLAYLEENIDKIIRKNTART